MVVGGARARIGCLPGADRVCRLRGVERLRGFRTERPAERWRQPALRDLERAGRDLIRCIRRLCLAREGDLGRGVMEGAARHFGLS